MSQDVDLSKLSKNERIELKKKLGLVKGNRHDRRLEKYTDNFNEIFNFFLRSYITKILIFGGEYVDVRFNPESLDGKETFRRFEDGQFKKAEFIQSNQPNIVKAVITAKKSWGLFVRMWSEGIADCDFTLEEILQQFIDRNINVPETLLKGFKNEIQKAKEKKYEKYLSGKV